VRRQPDRQLDARLVLERHLRELMARRRVQE